MPRSGVQRGLLLGRGERPSGARATLLSEYEPELLRGAQLRLMGTERRARLVELERTEQVDAEEAFLTADLLALRRAPR